jgi:hypothetical protein
MNISRTNAAVVRSPFIQDEGSFLVNGGLDKSGKVLQSSEIYAEMSGCFLSKGLKVFMIIAW